MYVISCYVKGLVGKSSVMLLNMSVEVQPYVVEEGTLWGCTPFVIL